MKDFVFCVSARGISKTASALRSSFDFLPYCFCFVNAHKLDFLFKILSELRLSKDIYIFKNNHSKNLLGKRTSKLF